MSTARDVLAGPSYLVTAAEVIAEMRAPKLETVDEMLDRIGTTREWAIDRVLAVGSLSMLIGRPGAGKSILAQMMAYAVVTGTPFLGRAVKKGLVVWLAFEGASQTGLNFKRLGISRD